MDSSYRALKAWAGLAAALIPLVAARGGLDTNTISANSSGEWHVPSTNRLEGLKWTTSGIGPLGTVKPGGLGLIVSGSPEGAVVERVVIGSLAWQAAVHDSDIILAVNNKLLTGLGMPRIAKLLREPTGSEIELTIRRPGQAELLKLKVKRAQPSPEVIP